MNTPVRTLIHKRYQIPKERSIKRAIDRFTSAEKALFFFFAGLFAFSGLVMFLKVNNSFLVDVPISGGEISEGVVGNPRFINPVLAISEADKNLVSLIYSGLVKVNSRGEIVNDLAESISLSEDKLTYTAVIRPEAYFHDNTPVTADDVVFTIQKILDSGIKSPLLADFAGVSVKKEDERTVSFTLKQPYAPFINNLMVGILPKQVWGSVTNDEFSFSQWNVLPIGSGPYKVGEVTRDSGGIPNYYDLEPFDKAIGSSPYISHFIFKFYPSESSLLDAYSSGDVMSLAGSSPEEVSLLEGDGAKVLSSPLPRVFGVFFNTNSNKALLDKSVRLALNTVTPKQEIIANVLGGYGSIIDSPLPISFYVPTSTNQTSLSAEERLSLASTTLAKAGWIKNKTTGILEKKSKSDTIKLSFTISTSDNPDLKRVAEELGNSWRELGAEVNISIYEAGDLNQNVIRPRRYDALLFGEVISRDADVYPFWHSKERTDPGLNIALYVNNQVDKLIESIRTENDKEKRNNLYRDFAEAIRSDMPAIFLYSPDFLYITPQTVKGVALGKINSPQDRYADVRNWYVETNAVWTIFAN